MTPKLTYHIGDALTVLRTLPDNSVHTVVTSPPYWALRSYLLPEHPKKHLEMGSEPTPQAFLERMTELFREVRRVLREDGTCWVNMGDTYNNKPCNSGNSFRRDRKDMNQAARATSDQFKVKDLCGMPWRFALALQADGWFLRSDIIWYKPNPAPESCTDRPTKAHEYIFLLTKQPHYYYDAEAIKEPVSPATHLRCSQGGGEGGVVRVFERGGGDGPDDRARSLPRQRHHRRSRPQHGPPLHRHRPRRTQRTIHPTTHPTNRLLLTMKPTPGRVRLRRTLSNARRRPPFLIPNSYFLLMKALSLLQPHATLVAICEKTIETRSWETLYRGPLAIHASAKFTKRDQRQFMELDEFSYYLQHELPLPTGAIIAVVNLVEVQPTSVWMERFFKAKQGDYPFNEDIFGNYDPGRFGWRFANIRRLPKPIPCKGARSLWTVPRFIETEINLQLATL